MTLSSRSAIAAQFALLDFQCEDRCLEVGGALSAHGGLLIISGQLSQLTRRSPALDLIPTWAFRRSHG